MTHLTTCAGYEALILCSTDCLEVCGQKTYLVEVWWDWLLPLLLFRGGDQNPYPADTVMGLPATITIWSSLRHSPQKPTLSASEDKEKEVGELCLVGRRRGNYRTSVPSWPQGQWHLRHYSLYQLSGSEIQKNNEPSWGKLKASDN